jgi:hypothetical protein
MDENHRRIRFGLRTLFELIAVAAFILTLIFLRQPRTETTGRYQLQEVKGGFAVLDTTTGEVWHLPDTTFPWSSLGKPQDSAR